MKFLLLRCFWTHIAFPPLLYFTFPLKLSCLDSSAKVSILSQKSMKNKTFGLEYNNWLSFFWVSSLARREWSDLPITR